MHACIQFVMVLLKGSVAISFGGNKEPAAFAEVASMWGINSAVKKQLIAAIGTILQDNLCVPRSRFFLKVFDTTAGRVPSKIWPNSLHIYCLPYAVQSDWSDNHHFISRLRFSTLLIRLNKYSLLSLYLCQIMSIFKIYHKIFNLVTIFICYLFNLNQLGFQDFCYA